MPTPEKIAKFGPTGNLVDSIVTESPGGLTVDPGGSPGLYTGTGNSELGRYLELLNSTAFTSASGLKTGGVLARSNHGRGDSTATASELARDKYGQDCLPRCYHDNGLSPDSRPKTRLWIRFPTTLACGRGH